MGHPRRVPGGFHHAAGAGAGGRTQCARLGRVVLVPILGLSALNSVYFIQPVDPSKVIGPQIPGSAGSVESKAAAGSAGSGAPPSDFAGAGAGAGAGAASMDAYAQQAAVAAAAAQQQQHMAAVHQAAAAAAAAAVGAMPHGAMAPPGAIPGMPPGMPMMPPPHGRLTFLHSAAVNCLLTHS